MTKLTLEPFAGRITSYFYLSAQKLFSQSKPIHYENCYLNYNCFLVMVVNSRNLCPVHALSNPPTVKKRYSTLIISRKYEPFGPCSALLAGTQWELVPHTEDLPTVLPRVQKPTKARCSMQSRTLASARRQCLRASCIPVPSSHQAKKWLVTSCSWGRQRCLRSPYLFNSELEEHSLVLDMEMLAVCTSLEAITSQEKWFIELCTTHSFHVLINRLNNKSLHFILASSHNAKTKSLALF